MAQATRNEPPQPEPAIADPAAAWSTEFVENCLRLQRLQWDALAAWQQGFATFSKDFWEQWACRYAGGVPIDA